MGTREENWKNLEKALRLVLLDRVQDLVGKSITVENGNEYMLRQEVFGDDVKDLLESMRSPHYPLVQVEVSHVK